MNKIILNRKQLNNLNKILIEEKLRTYIFDWDDNILFMPTKIKMDVLDNGVWVPVDVSTEEYAKIRNNKNYRLRNNNPDEAFEDFRVDAVFLEDVVEAIHSNSFAPSAVKFKEALVYTNSFGINTARGHKPDTIKSGVKLFIDMVLTSSEKKTMVENIKMSLPKTLKLSDDESVDVYLNEMGEYYPVSSDEFGTKFGVPVVGGAANPEQAKKIAIKDFVEKILNQVNQLVDNDKYTKMSVGFSDDDIRNVKAVESFIELELKKLYPNIHFVVYDTSEKGKRKIVIKKEGLSETTLNNINESRVSDGFEKYKKEIEDERDIGTSAYDYYVNSDFNKETNYKYLPWLLKFWYGNHYSDFGYDDLLGMVGRFHDNVQLLDNKDINTYTPEELKQTLVAVLEKREKKIASKKVVKILDDADYLILEPKTHESSCVYGGGTKWCTATKGDDSRFRQYTESGKLLYLIDKNKKENNPLYKIAILYPGGGGKPEIYNAPDKIIKTDLENLLPDYVIEVIKKHIFADRIVSGEERYEISDKFLSKKLAGGQYMYKGFNIYYDSFSGVVYWQLVDDQELLKEYDLVEFGVVATPFWGGNVGVPVDFFFQRNTGPYVDSIAFGDIDIPEEYLTTYDSVKTWLENYYFGTVYDTIISFILPKIGSENL